MPLFCYLLYQIIWLSVSQCLLFEKFSHGLLHLVGSVLC
jgi:hypothetical protein